MWCFVSVEKLFRRFSNLCCGDGCFCFAFYHYICVFLFLCFRFWATACSIKYWPQFFLLWIVFGPRQIVFDPMVMMMMILHFQWNVNGFNDSLCMIMSVMLHWNMNTNPNATKKEKIQLISFVHVNCCVSIVECVAYLDELATVSSAKNATKIMIIAIQVKIWK